MTTIGGNLDINIYDIARIEVLRGPQGTLYGASSEAGTIRIITNKPDPSGFSGGADAELNTVRHGGIGGGVQGFVNAPLGDSAALRVVGWYRHDAGYIDNVPGTRAFLPQPGGIVINNAPLVEEDFNDVDVIGGRAALGIDLDDNWTATREPDRPGPEERRHLRLRPQRRRPPGPAFLPGQAPRPLPPGGAHRRGQDQQLGPDLCRRLSDPEDRFARTTIPIMPRPMTPSTPITAGSPAISISSTMPATRSIPRSTSSAATATAR